jgi:hypothetical protein
MSTDACDVLFHSLHWIDGLWCLRHKKKLEMYRQKTTRMHAQSTMQNHLTKEIWSATWSHMWPVSMRGWRFLTVPIKVLYAARSETPWKLRQMQTAVPESSLLVMQRIGACDGNDFICFKSGEGEAAAWKWERREAVLPEPWRRVSKKTGFFAFLGSYDAFLGAKTFCKDLEHWRKRFYLKSGQERGTICHLFIPLAWCASS